MSRLSDCVALVTGSSSGLGRAIALAFAAQGTRLIICADLQATARTEIPDEITVPTHELIVQRYGEGRAIFVKTNVCVTSEVEACIVEAVKRGGRLDILVNNAGGGIMGVRVHETTEEEWEASFGLNVRSTFLASKYACAQFLTQSRDRNDQRGAIINIASIGGLVGLKDCGAYSASKAAVVNLTRVVALEYANDGIRCNALCPGFIKTALTKLAFEDGPVADFFASSTPLKKHGNLEDVARAAVFLASSEEAGWITGVPMPIDGGFVAR